MAPQISFTNEILAMRQLNKTILSVAALGCSLSAAQAQTSSEDSSISQQDLQPIEVRALRAGSNAPFAKTDITAKDIRQHNVGQDLPYLLQYTPSAVVTSDAGAGIGYTGIRVRGTDGVRINVTLNGVPVNDAESQGTFFVNFADIASSTSSIQLQRGVGTSTNGPGAFGATMSISNLLQMEEPGIEFSNSFGSFNTWKNTLRAGTGLMKNGLQFDVRLSKITSDGFRDRSASDLKSLQLTSGWKINPKTSLRFMLMSGTEKTGQAWNGVHEAQLKGDLAELTRHYQHNVGVMYFTPQDSVNMFHSDSRKYNYFTYQNQTDNYQQDYYQLFLDHKFSSHLTGNIAFFLTRGRGYYEEYKPQESFSSYGLADFVSPSLQDTISQTNLVRQLWLDNYFYGSVFSLMYARNNTRLTLGGNYSEYKGDHYGFIKWAQYNVPDDYRWYLLNSKKNDFNIYLKAEQHITDKFIVYGDLQYRNIAYDINGFRKNPTLMPFVSYNFFNPKAGISYLLRSNATQRQRLYASVAVANKEPNRDDFEASPVNLPKPERLTDFEAGYELNKKSWSIGANAYYMMYKDQLVLTGKINDVGAYARTNVPESYRAGLELQGAVRPMSWLDVFGNATFSQNKIRNFTEYIDVWDDFSQEAIHHGTTDIAFSPNLVGAGGIKLSPFRSLSRGQHFEIELLEKYVGRQYLDNTGDKNRSIAAYYLSDARVRYSIGIKPFREVSAVLALNNLLNKKYESNGYTYTYRLSGTTYTDNFYFPQAGFNWLLGITLKW